MSKKAYAVSSDFSVEKVLCFHRLSNTHEKLKIKATKGLCGTKGSVYYQNPWPKEDKAIKYISFRLSAGISSHLSIAL